MLNNIEKSIFRDIEFSKGKEFENMDIYTLEFNYKDFIIPTQNDLMDIFENIPNRDSLSIQISMDSLDPIYLSEVSNYENFVEELNGHYKPIYDSESKFTFKVHVKKRVKNNILTFYSNEKFKDYISEKSLAEVLSFFNELIVNYGFFHFSIRDSSIDGTNYCSSNTFCITWNSNEYSLDDTCKYRKNKIQKRNTICNPVNTAYTVLIPDDFHLIAFNNANYINKLFNRLRYILSLTFICDITQIDKNKLYYKINGYRPIEGTINFNDELDSDELFKVYSWIYSDGNISDKVGLARNIISLNIKTNILDMSDNVFGSIISGYEIYLKENVKQYIEVKNKVSEFLIDKSLQSSKLVRSFASSLKNTNYVFLTFFMSFIVFKTLSPDSSRIFTHEIILLSYAALIISVSYLFVSIIFINMDINRLNDQYEKIKSLYTDLLSEEDINSIFIDKEHVKDTDYIKSKRNLFSIVWGLELFVLLIFVTTIGGYWEKIIIYMRDLLSKFM